MKVVFPTNDANGLESTRSEHFGKANYYTVIDILDDGTKEVSCVDNKQEEHSCVNSANAILSLNADALVVFGIGGRPASIFHQNGLNVFIDRQSSNIKDSLELYLSNQLDAINGKGTCSHH